VCRIWHAPCELFAVNTDLERANWMIRTLKAFLADESGATAIEYGLIAAGIALAIISVVNGLGSKLSTKFAAINTSLK
jgi:pilus assembly protein Flp/PilA